VLVVRHKHGLFLLESQLLHGVLPVHQRDNEVAVAGRGGPLDNGRVAVKHACAAHRVAPNGDQDCHRRHVHQQAIDLMVCDAGRELRGFSVAGRHAIVNRQIPVSCAVELTEATEDTRADLLEEAMVRAELRAC